MLLRQSSVTLNSCELELTGSEYVHSLYQRQRYYNQWLMAISIIDAPLATLMITDIDYWFKASSHRHGGCSKEMLTVVVLNGTKRGRKAMSIRDISFLWVSAKPCLTHNPSLW